MLPTLWQMTSACDGNIWKGFIPNNRPSWYSETSGSDDALRVESYEPSKGQQSFVLNVKPRVDGSSIKAKSVNEFPAISKSS